MIMIKPKFWDKENSFISILLYPISLIIIFGVNTDIVKCLTSIPILTMITYILNSKKEKIFFKHLILVLSLFVIAIILSNFNLMSETNELRRNEYKY